MKLILVYNIFDGLELLEGSIQQVYSECEKIILHYQTISNSGEVDHDVEKFLEKKSHQYTKTTLLKYEPSLELSGSQNEKLKRQLGINHSRELGATHYLLIDCDEFYPAEYFRRAKQTIEDNNFDSSACRLYTYYKCPSYRLTPIENYFVPFIHSIECDLTDNYDVYADPTRGAKGSNFYGFNPDELMMHHFSWVRTDIEKKLRNSSAKINWQDKIADMVKQFHNFQLGDEILPFPHHSINLVDNQFRIHI